jgi:putative phage-type endonuclease
MIVIPHPQGSPEWLSARVGVVTASRIADILATNKDGRAGAGRAGYLGELVAEILTGVSAESAFMNDDIRRGVDLEPDARFAYEVKTNRVVETVGLVMHPTMKAGASPDGLVDPDGLVEIKCPRTHVHIGYIEAGKPPTKYLPQMEWQCVCTGRSWVDFVSYDPRMPEPLQLFVARHTPAADRLRELEAIVRAFIVEVDEKVALLKRIAA